MARIIDATAYNDPSGTFDASMQEWYSKMLGASVPHIFPEIKWMKKSGSVKKPKGKYAVFHFTDKPSSGGGWRGESDYVAEADKVEGVQGKFALRKTIKARVGLTWEALKFGKVSNGAFVDSKKQEFDMIQTVIKQRAVPAIWGNGDAVLGHIDGAVSASATVVMHSDEVYNKLAPGTRWMFPGMKVISTNTPGNSYGLDAAPMAAAVEIKSIESDVSMTMASTISATDDYVLIEHQCSDTANATEKTKGSATIDTASSSRWPSGINQMCDDGTFTSSYGGISETDHPAWKAVVSHASGVKRPFTTQLARNLVYKMGKKTGDPMTAGNGTVCWMNTDLYQSYIEQLEPFIEYTPRKLKPGEDVFDVMFHGTQIPIMLSYHVPSYAYFLNPKYIRFWEHTPPSVASDHSGMWDRVTDKDSFEAMFRWGFQIGTEQRDAQGVIRDLSVTISSV
jgi:hypothetical protein